MQNKGCPLKKTIPCNYCKKDFSSSFFVPGRTPKYCSKLCMSFGFRKNIKKINCETCKTYFEVKEDNHTRRFCSPSCISTVSKGDARLSHRLGESFWKTATEAEKMEHYSQMFESKVIKNEEGCWGWKSFINSTGCGMIGSRDNLISAYRFSYMFHKGPIPSGLCILHICHDRVCSRPDHLYAGTNKDNSRDMLEAGRGNFCKQNSKNAKLNIEKVKLIKQLLIEGISQQKIANKFEVSRGTIQNIKENVTWKDI